MAELNNTLVKGTLNTTGNLFEKSTRVLTGVKINGTSITPSEGSVNIVAIPWDIISSKPTIPATNIIPAQTTANKLLLSTSTSGTASWSNWSTAGFLKTNNSGIINIDNTSYVPTARTINDIELSSDITLTDSDITCDAVQTHGWNNVADAIDALVTIDTNYVPKTRTINSKALSSNIVLDADDISYEGQIADFTGQSLTEILDASIVQGTNDGTNWTSLTIGETTKNIPTVGIIDLT